MKRGAVTDRGNGRQAMIEAKLAIKMYLTLQEGAELGEVPSFKLRLHFQLEFRVLREQIHREVGGGREFTHISLLQCSLA